MKTYKENLAAYIHVIEMCEKYNKEHGTDVKPWRPETTERELSELKTALKLEQRKMLENLIAGALFDFAGYLTTRSQAVTFSASHDSLPAFTLIVEFLKLRGVSNNCKPEVTAWDKLINKQG